MALDDLITLVDADDQVIGEASIRECRAKGLTHRIVRVMIENPSTGQILLQKRAPTKPLWPNCWDNSAAGHVDAGEDYLTAARRELFEELGIDTDKLVDFQTYFTDTHEQGGHLKRFNKVYKYETSKLPTNIGKDEVTEVRWFSVEEARQLVSKHPDLVSDGLRDVIKRYY